MAVNESLRTAVFIIAAMEIICQVIANIGTVKMKMRLDMDFGKWGWVVIVSGNVLCAASTALLIYGTVLQNRLCLWSWLAIILLLVILLLIVAMKYIFLGCKGIHKLWAELIMVTFRCLHSLSSSLQL